MTKTFDVWTFLAIIGLSFFSLFNLFGIKKELFLRQGIYFLVGFLLFFIFYQLKLRFFQDNIGFFYLLGVFFLVVFFFFAPEIRGAKRWVDFYFFRFQPAEFLKPFFIIYLADWFAKGDKDADKGKGFSLILKVNQKVFDLFFIVLPILIIFKQPDLGNSLLYLIVYFGILFFVGFPLRNFIYLFLLAVFLIPIIWRVLAPYQQNRILAFINPGIDSKGISYNLIQAIITVGSGGLSGRGLGFGKQSRLAFLPENHTDFAFASLVEQFGFVGGFAAISLYGLIIFRLIKKSQQFYNKKFLFLFLTGTVLFLTVQIFINIGMNLGILPITGIALPLISYGGSSVVSTMMWLGLTVSL